MNNTRFIFFIGLIILVLIILGVVVPRHKTTQDARSDKQLIVTTSIYPLYFLAHEIAGGNITITNITPAGVEPHDYELTPSDMTSIGKSDLLITNGGGLEPWQDNMSALRSDSRSLLVISDKLTIEHKTSDTAITDPHYWLSPAIAKQMSRLIAERLIALDPDNEVHYRTNEAALSAKLDVLDTEYRTRLTSCARRDLITSHSAFGYLASEYHLNAIGIAGIDPESEPSPKQLATLTDLVRERGATTIFTEALVSPKLSEALARETGAQTVVLDPLESIPTEAQGFGANYFSIMRSNLARITQALGCTP